MCRILRKAGYVASLKIQNEKDPVFIHAEAFNPGDAQIDNLICYCFEYTKDDIEQDFTRNGRSIIMEKIAEEKKAGGCDCANKNPKRR
jgi:hypothetical protein